MTYLDDFNESKEEANTFLTRKLLKNSWHHFEEMQQGNLDRECLQEDCSYEEAREVFETDVDGLKKFWDHYTGQTDNASMDNPVGLIIGIVFGIIAFIIILIVIYIVWKRRKMKKEMKMRESSRPYTSYPMIALNTNRNGSPAGNHYESPLIDNFDNDLALGLSKCYIERERLQLGKVITSGNFGDVWEGKLKMRDSSVVDVAVKSLKNVSEKEDVEKFLREGVMMRGLDHKNVLSLIGVCVDGEVEHCQTSPLIILPFMKNGDLRTFLRDGNNVLTVLHLVKFCKQIALGMEYLAEKNFVHRDLAARNCMVDENWRVKVADFGLSRDLYDRDYYRSSVKTQLPLKWMPPESIKYGRYDEKTDAWSYGILCWEIMTRGAIPYPTVQAVAILEYITDGNRMDRPECCPYKLYKLMKKCWKDDPGHRPTFRELVRSTDDILHEAKQSVRRRNGGSEASSSIAGSSRGGGNPYENSEKRNDVGSAKRPTPKPRNSLKQTNRARPDERASDNKETGKREKMKRNEHESGDAIDEIDSSRQHSVSHQPNTHQDVELGEYNDSANQDRTISV